MKLFFKAKVFKIKKVFATTLKEGACLFLDQGFEHEKRLLQFGYWFTLKRYQ